MYVFFYLKSPITKLWFSEKPCPLCHGQLLIEHIDRGRAETDIKIRKR